MENRSGVYIVSGRAKLFGRSASGDLRQPHRRIDLTGGISQTRLVPIDLCVCASPLRTLMATDPCALVSNVTRAVTRRQRYRVVNEAWERKHRSLELHAFPVGCVCIPSTDCGLGARLSRL